MRTACDGCVMVCEKMLNATSCEMQKIITVKLYFDPHRFIIVENG